MISHGAIAIALIFTDAVMFQLAAVPGVALLAGECVNPAWRGIFGA